MVASLKTEASPPNGGALPETAGLDSDLLEGADRIAEFLFGSAKRRRTIYHLAEKSRLPVFRLGAVLCARRSTLTTWIAEQERRAVQNGADR
jgi:hypothetical protein